MKKNGHIKTFPLNPRSLLEHVRWHGLKLQPVSVFVSAPTAICIAINLHPAA